MFPLNDKEKSRTTLGKWDAYVSGNQKYKLCSITRTCNQWSYNNNNNSRSFLPC
jgi:hypothetical protein